MADDVRSIEIEKATPADLALERASRRRRMLIGLAAGAGLLVLGVIAYQVFVGSRHVVTDNAYVGASSAQISAQVSGLIAAAPVGETAQVKAGDLLVAIDPADANLSVARAEAQYRLTVQRVRQYFAQESGGAAQIVAREADVARAQSEYARREQLAATGAVSAEELSGARAALDGARANLEAAREAHEAQRALTQGTRVDNHPETRAARAVLDAARLDLSRTRIVAPIDGVIVQSRVQIGQKVSPETPLMTIVPLQQAFVDANFKETQLGRVRVGQLVALTSDYYGANVVFHGRVAGVGAGSGSAYALVPAQNATGNWIKVVQRVPVRISLDPQELAAHPLRVGLSMRASIDVSRH